MIHQQKQSLEDVLSLERYIKQVWPPPNYAVVCLKKCGFQFSSSLSYSFIYLLIPWQEVNVRKITVSSDKQKFGVRLRAEPDNQALGRRLKGAFKEVSQAIKGTTSKV